METTHEIACPKCNKKNVLIGSPTVFSIIKWFIYIVLGGSFASFLVYLTGKFSIGLIVFILIGIVVKSIPNMVRLVCKECGYKWRGYF